MILQFVGIILLASIARYIVGIIWYMKWGIFGRAWLRLQNAESMSQYKMSKNALQTFSALLMTIISTFALSLFSMSPTGAQIVPTLFTVVLLWLGFIVPTILSRRLYDIRNIYPWGLFWIDSIYELVALICAGLILVVFL